jgi:Citrate synthase, C-terminal domain
VLGEPLATAAAAGFERVDGREGGVADLVVAAEDRVGQDGFIYQAMGFPVEMLPVLFAIGRMPGWLAQWREGIGDPEQKISRPRQLYVGEGLRHVEPSVDSG